MNKRDVKEKVFSLILSVIVTLGLTACGNNS